MARELIITCSGCKQQLEHVCDAKLPLAIKKLYKWKPEDGMPAAVIAQAKKWNYFAPGDEKAPFFSEAFLYCLLGKEDARTFMSLIVATGLDEHALRSAAYQEMAAIEKKREEQLAWRAEVDARRARNNARTCTCEHIYGKHHSTEESFAERKGRRPCAVKGCICSGFVPKTREDVIEVNPPRADEPPDEDE